jgi:hypothetical protein
MKHMSKRVQGNFELCQSIGLCRWQLAQVPGSKSHAPVAEKALKRIGKYKQSWRWYSAGAGPEKAETIY